MKPVLAIAAAAAFVACVSHQASAQIATTDTWRGGVLITDVTAACEQPGFPVKNQTMNAVLRPKFESADPPASLLLTFANGALLATPTSTAIPTPNSGSYTGVLISGAATTSTYSGAGVTYNINAGNIQPTSVQTNIVGTINKFRNIAGCTVKFRGALVKGVP